jgi:hypothetical protein
MGIDPFRAHLQALCDLGHRRQVWGVSPGRGAGLARKLEETPRYRIDQFRMQPSASLAPMRLTSGRSRGRMPASRQRRLSSRLVA